MESFTQQKAMKEKQARHARLQASVDFITQSAFDAWREHEAHNTLLSIRTIHVALPALAKMNGHYNGTSLLQWLADAVTQTKDITLRKMAVSALMSLGANGAADPVIETLVRSLIETKDSWLCTRSAYVLGKMGAAASDKEPVRSALVEVMTTTESYDVRQYAVEALGRLGAAASDKKPIRAALLQGLTQTENRPLRCQAAKALGNMGIATESVLEALIEATTQLDDYSLREEAAKVLHVLDAKCPWPEPVFIDLIQALMQTEDKRQRYQAADALMKIGSATDFVLESLFEALTQTRDADLQQKATLILSKVGARAATELILSALLEALMQTYDIDLSGWAALALGELGVYAVDEEPIRAALLQHLAQIENIYLYERVLEALGKIEAVAAPTSPYTPLAQIRVQTKDDRLREAIVKTAMTKGTAATPTDLLANLIDAVAKGDSDAAWALRAMGATAATEPVLAALVTAMEQPEHKYLRQSAAEALGVMGLAAATEPVLNALLRASAQTRDDFLRQSAIEALGKMGAEYALKSDQSANHQMPGCETAWEAAYKPILEAVLEALSQKQPDAWDWDPSRIYDDDPHEDLRRIGAIAAGKMGHIAFNHEPIRTALLEAMTQRGNRKLCANAAEALRSWLDRGWRMVGPRTGVYPFFLASDPSHHYRFVHVSKLGELVQPLRAVSDLPFVSVEDRFKMVVMHLEGHTRQEISAALGCSEQDVCHWLERYQTLGYSGLSD